MTPSVRRAKTARSVGMSHVPVSTPRVEGRIEGMTSGFRAPLLSPLAEMNSHRPASAMLQARDERRPHG
jgi:hypothetical protein